MHSQQQQRPWFRNPFVLYFLIGVTLLTAARLLWPEKSPVPEPLAGLPEWELTDPEGNRFGSDDLEGRVYIASFFFTRCKTICPALTRSMRSLQDSLAEQGVDTGAVRLVSISVDPEHDGPEKLQAFAELHGVDPARWTLLTGQRETIRALLEEGFMVGMGELNEPTEGLFDIAHSAKFALVDRSGGMRGHYASEGHERDILLQHAVYLAEHTQP